MKKRSENSNLKRLVVIFSFLLMISTQSLQAQNVSFSVDSIITTGVKTHALVCEDFNGDHMPDVAVSIINKPVSDPVAVFLNDGAGKLNSEADSLYLMQDDVKALAAGDLNNDQNIDLAIAIYEDSLVLIMLGDGNGKFTNTFELKTPAKPNKLLITDLDNDQNNDIVVLSGSARMMIYMGDGQLNFSEPVVVAGIGSAQDVAACDLNNDGYLDLLTGSGNIRAVLMFLNDGQGGFPEKKSLPTYRPSWFVDTADFNRDSYPDIVAGSGSYDSDNVYVLMGNSNVEFTCPDTLSPGTYVADITAADINGDKNPDIVVVDRNGLYILIGSGDGNFLQIDTLAYDEGLYQAEKVEIVDMDGDTRLDLVVAREENISVYYNTGPFTSLNNPEMIATDFQLNQNYPNPFNPSTSIKYQIKEPGFVELAVYNLLGQKVQTLAEGQHSVGTHIVTFDGTGLSSGIYFYRLKTKKQSLYRKMQLIK